MFNKERISLYIAKFTGNIGDALKEERHEVLSDCVMLQSACTGGLCVSAVVRGGQRVFLSNL